MRGMAVPSRGNPTESMYGCLYFHCQAGCCDLFGSTDLVLLLILVNVGFTEVVPTVGGES